MGSCNCKNAAYSMCKRGLLGIPPRATGALEATALYRKLSLTLALAMTACILIVGAGVASAQDTYEVNYFGSGHGICTCGTGD